MSMKIVIGKREFLKRGVKLGVGLLPLGMISKRLPITHKIELRFDQPVNDDNYGPLCRELMDLDKFRPIFAKFFNKGKLLDRTIKHSGNSSFITMYFDSQESLAQWKQQMKVSGIIKSSRASKVKIVG